MKIIFDNDHEADEFFKETIRRVYIASGLVMGAGCSELSKFLNDHADRLCVSYFSHYHPRIAAGMPSAPPPETTTPQGAPPTSVQQSDAPPAKAPPAEEAAAEIVGRIKTPAKLIDFIIAARGGVPQAFQDAANTAAKLEPGVLLGEQTPEALKALAERLAHYRLTNGMQMPAVGRPGAKQAKEPNA